MIVTLSLPDEATAAAINHIILELAAARRKHPPMNSPHEGHSVIREELDELWDHVKADTGRTLEAKKEAFQIATMGLRYVLDLCSTPNLYDDKRFDVA